MSAAATGRASPQPTTGSSAARSTRAATRRAERWRRRPPRAARCAARTYAPRPTTLDGSLLRLDPSTGAALPSNPLFASSDANTRRIVAHGLRNPFRFTMRPGTNEVWIGDVGWSTWEEINRVVSPTSGVTNFGWPCYEGNPTQAGYDSANLNLCESLYAGGGHAPPYYTYNPGSKLYYGDLGGTVRRIRYFPGEQPPTAGLNASPTSGTIPLTVSFDGSASFDPDPADQNLLTYQWDFTNDGSF